MDNDGSGVGGLVLRSNDSGGFSQSGQVDWVSVLRGTIEASVSVITRLSGAGIHTGTALVAQQVFSTLPLSAHGEQRVLKALSSLRAFSAFGDVLWFGFGIKHVTRDLAQTRGGLSCVALCAALGEIHGADLSAMVLSSFADLKGVPKHASPSLEQWQRLVKACSGCLVQSDFGDLVRQFTDFYRLPSHTGPPEASNPQDLARALTALASVISGQLYSITLTGGPECGWLGAVAQWLLGLSVSFESGKDRLPLYRDPSGRPYEEPQVRIILESEEASSGNNASLVIRQSYRLGKISDIIRGQLSTDSALLCIRVPRECALKSTFGERPVNLLTVDLRDSFVAAVGSAARLFECVASADPNVPRRHDRDDIFQKNSYYYEGTYGLGLIRSVACCFPELSGVTEFQAMEFTGGTFHEALAAYDKAIDNIWPYCQCEFHLKKRGVLDPSASMSKSPICIVALLEVIVCVAHASAMFVVEGQVMPSQKGLHNIYRTILFDRVGSSIIDRFLRSGLSDPLSFATALYAGCHPGLVRSNESIASAKALVSATVEKGLCFYLDALCGLSSSPESLSRVHIVPGCIELDQRSFSTVRDARFQGPQYNARRSCVFSSLREENLPDIPDDLRAPEIIPDEFKVEAVATEMVNGVCFSYKVSSPRGESWIPPAALAKAAAQARGQVSCSSSTRCSKPHDIPFLEIVEGEGVIADTPPSPLSLSKLCRIRFVQQAGPAWCVALMSAYYNSHSEDYRSIDRDWGSVLYSYSRRQLLRDEECLWCCLATLARSSGEIICRV